MPRIIEEFKLCHSRVYEVYSLGGQPRKIHNLLAESFVDEALTLEYIEHFTTLHYMIKEETAIDIRQIDYNNVELLEFTSHRVSLDADWSVGGVVTHQRHKHTRVNRYRAVYTALLQDDGTLRITETKMRNMERIRRATDEDILNGTDAGGGYLDPLDLLDAGILEDLEKEKSDAGN